MNPWCFDLNDAYFAYHSNDPVLHVDQLRLESGKIYFIVGRSGVGKSTLLEALGLMNDTVHPRTQQAVFKDSKDEVYDIDQLYRNSELATEVRSKEFSFIFQDTNLMPNLTAGENMMLSNLVSDRDSAVVERRIKMLLPKFELPPETFGKQVQHLSGGQRQRLAFIRAFVADYSVLFGDEPTGNLDPVTARNIMQVVKSEIAKYNKTCVIVSHDIHLAIEMADAIIYIKPAKDKLSGKELGFIGVNQIFTFSDGCWHKGDLRCMDHAELYQYLFDQLKDSKSYGQVIQ